MKTLLLLLLTLNLLGQEKPAPYFSLGVTNSGALGQAGGFYKKWELTLEGKTAYSSNEGLKVAGIFLGRKMFKWVTPGIGVAYVTNTSFEEYNRDYLGRAVFEPYENITVLYSLEIRRTWWFFKAAYAEKFYFGGGIKFHKKWENY